VLGVADYCAKHRSPAGHRLLEDSEMSKKKRADIGKLVDAQAKGKKVTGSKTDTKGAESRDLDVRASKGRFQLEID
jgi:hypothetical protein